MTMFSRKAQARRVTENRLPPGWRITELLESRQTEYVKAMVAELSALPRQRRETPTTFNGKPIEELTQAEREEFHFSQQCESTQKALLAQKNRKPHEDIDYLLRPMPECIANPEAKSLDELTSKRTLDPSEVIQDKSLKQGRNQLGQSEKGSVDADKRQKGIEAFTYSEPAKLTEEQVKKLTKLQEIVNTPLEPIEKPKKSWKNIWGFLQGHAGIEMFDD